MENGGLVCSAGRGGLVGSAGRGGLDFERRFRGFWCGFGWDYFPRPQDRHLTRVHTQVPERSLGLDRGDWRERERRSLKVRFRFRGLGEKPLVEAD